MNEFKILTATHNQFEMQELENFIISADKNSSAYKTALLNLKNAFALEELMYLNTCNRITYFFTTHKPADENFTTQFFKKINPGIEACKTISINLYEGEHAIRHLCEIGSSLDSMVLGEREILRQLRLAYDESNALGLTGDNIRLAMKFIIPAAKKIYTETKIAEKNISIVSLAFQKLKKLKVPLHAKFILIGAGQTIKNMSEYLLHAGYSDFTIFNRSAHTAQELAQKINGKYFNLSELSNYTGNFDVLISSTASNEPVITSSVYATLIKNDVKEKVIIDLAIPHDIEKNIVENYPVKYIEIESLRSLAKQNIDSRKKEKIKAKKMIDVFVKEFQSVYMQRLIEKAHAIIPHRLHAIKTKALEEVFAKDIEMLDEDAKETLHSVIDYLEKKYIALTMASSKEAFKYKI